MKLKNDGANNIYYEVMAMFFKIVHIAKSEAEANEYMTNNKNCSVISAHKVDYWFESSEPYYPEDLTEEESENFEVNEYYVKGDEITATQSTGTMDIFVVESKYFTYARFCSPCAPGACDLSSFIEDDQPESNKCYCFGKDWFEKEEISLMIFMKLKRENLFSKKFKKMKKVFDFNI